MYVKQDLTKLARRTGGGGTCQGRPNVWMARRHAMLALATRTLLCMPSTTGPADGLHTVQLRPGNGICKQRSHTQRPALGALEGIKARPGSTPDRETPRRGSLNHSAGSTGRKVYSGDRGGVKTLCKTSLLSILVAPPYDSPAAARIVAIRPSRLAIAHAH